MLPIAKILVPVDFSDRCLSILPWAKAIASQFEAELVLLHVASPAFVIPAAGPTGPTVIPLSQSAFAEVIGQLDAFGRDQLQDVHVRRLVYEGDPVGQITEFSATENVDLIVMATHGRGILRRFLIGSVTAKLLHDVSCPVLTGAHIKQAGEPKPVRFSHILCAVDLEQESRQTLEWAHGCAVQFGARLDLMHVAASLDAQPETYLRTALADLARSVGAEPAATYVEEGDAAENVCAKAESVGADLLVIGRGSQEGATARLRANAYAIVSESPCPVVSV